MLQVNLEGGGKGPYVVGSILCRAPVIYTDSHVVADVISSAALDCKLRGGATSAVCPIAQQWSSTALGTY